MRKNEMSKDSVEITFKMSELTTELIFYTVLSDILEPSDIVRGFWPSLQKLVNENEKWSWKLGNIQFQAPVPETQKPNWGNWLWLVLLFKFLLLIFTDALINWNWLYSID